MRIDLKRQRPVLANNTGAFRQCDFSVALRMVWQVYEAVSVPSSGWAEFPAPRMDRDDVGGVLRKSVRPTEKPLWQQRNCRKSAVRDAEVWHCNVAGYHRRRTLMEKMLSLLRF
jgi:hypothetical protein